MVAVQRFFLPAAAALLASSSAAAQLRPDTVHLTFDWPVGTTARVEQERVRVDASPRGRDSTDLRAAYRLSVLAHPRGRLVQLDSFQLVSMHAPAATGSGGEVQGVLARVSALQPSYIVSAEGEFLDLHGIEALKALLDSMLGPLLRAMPDAPAEARALLTRATSAEILTAGAAQEWNMIVGTWAGATWEVGEVYELTADEPVPLLGNITVPMHYQFSAAERVACLPEEAARRCVRLEMRSAPDTGAMRALIGELVSRLAPDKRQEVEALGDMRMANDLTVIAEPGTLRPYGMTLVRRVEMLEREAPGAESKRATRTDTRAYRYRYAR